MPADRRNAGGIQEALVAFDTSLATGDATAFVGLLAEDVELMWHYNPTIVGRSAVDQAFRQLFATYDTSAWKADHHTIEIHDNAAYVISDISETLRPYEGDRATRRIEGRIVLFWRWEEDGWRITRLLSARSAPEDIS